MALSEDGSSRVGFLKAWNLHKTTVVFSGVLNGKPGQISIIPKPELRGFW